MSTKQMFLVWGVIILCGVAALLFVMEHRLRTATVSDLIRAVHAQDKTEVGEILKRRPELVNARNRQGFTALYMVCNAPPQIDMAEFLIEKGADVNAKMGNKATVLVHAVKSLQPEIVKVLLTDGRNAERDVLSAERQLAALLNDGWEIVAAGGGAGKVIFHAAGFVVLQKDE